MNRKRFIRFAAKGYAVLLLFCATVFSATALQAGPSPEARAALLELQYLTTGQSSVSTGSATELASFVRFDSNHPQLRQAARQNFDQQTRAFLASHGRAFGLRQASTDIELVGQRTDANGLGLARYRQVYQGLPVFGAELVSHFDRNQQLAAISASTLEIGPLSIQARWSELQATDIAQQAVERSLPARTGNSGLRVIHSQLMVYHTGLLQGVPGRNRLVWQAEVANDALSVREFVLVDAHNGKVLNQISGIHTALDRKVSETSLANVVWQDSFADPDPIPAAWAGGNASQTQAWQDEIDGARESYNLIASLTAGSWLSYDNADATMRTINNNPAISCPNASWNGVTANFCNGISSDNTVAHEWGHAYTEYSADLIYQWQSGALNESFSDIWGEVVDFLNGRGTDAPLTPRTAASCSVYGAGPNMDDSYRWLLGEDDPGFGGAIRDMWTPGCYGDPGKVSDNQYWCSASDGGGVHSNSGVPNHAFALLTDGGSYNAESITGLGLTKSAHIFWNALQLLVPASDFAQLADALETACASLDGLDLPQLSTSQTAAGLSGEIISSADCTELAKVINAVELRMPPSQCNFQTLLDTDPPPRCEGAGELQSISLADWESGLGSWTSSTHDVVKPSAFDTPDWAIVSELPDNRAGSGVFVADLIIGDCINDDESGALALDSPVILLPENLEVPRLSLNHWMASEFSWDGGNLKLSVNGGAFALIPATALEVSPYNTSLQSIAAGNTNPLASQPAFSGSDSGSLEGSWGQTQVNLSGLAEAGDNIRLRLDFGIDGCNGLVGWYVDEVEVYSCSDELAPSDCGNGVLDETEQCDDGDRQSGDGCSDSCAIEPGWQCSPPTAAITVPDHSFETGGSWAVSSTHFGTPVCTEAECGLGTGTGPSDGNRWVWFGGIVNETPEQGSVAQSLTLPATSPQLSFDLELPACDSAADYMEMRLDGNVVLRVDGADPACDVTGYSTRAVDISAYADDTSHLLEFYSETFSENGNVSNFFIDRILLAAQPGHCSAIVEELIFEDGFEAFPYSSSE